MDGRDLVSSGLEIAPRVEKETEWGPRGRV